MYIYVYICIYIYIYVTEVCSWGCPWKKSPLVQVKACCRKHDEVIKWKHFLRYRPFVWGIHWSPVNSPHKGQWRGALIFSLICVWTNGWVNYRGAGDLRRHSVHYDLIVMKTTKYCLNPCWQQICRHVASPGHSVLKCECLVARVGIISKHCHPLKTLQIVWWLGVCRFYIWANDNDMKEILWYQHDTYVLRGGAWVNHHDDIIMTGTRFSHYRPFEITSGPLTKDKGSVCEGVDLWWLFCC